MDDHSKVVVAVLQVNLEPWNSIFEFGQLPTWMGSCPDGMQIVNLYGKKPNRLIKKIDEAHECLRLSPLGNGIAQRVDLLVSKVLKRAKIPKFKTFECGNTTKMEVGVSSTLLTQVIREFSLFRYFLFSTSAKYLYMTNTSSYVNLENLNKFIKTLPENEVYGGTLLQFGHFKFNSGANRIFSRDVVKILLENFNKVDYRYLNDVAIGDLLSKYNFLHVEISSMTFANLDEIKITSTKEIKEIVHFRLKSGDIYNRNDSKLMQEIHRIINN